MTPSLRKAKRPRGFTILITGQVKLFKTSPDGKEYILRLVGPGETFAEAAVFGEIPYPATAIALEECQTLFFPKGPFLHHLAESPALARNMLATLSRLMFHLTKQLEDLSLKEVSARAGPVYPGKMPATHGGIMAGLAVRTPHHQNAVGRLPGHHQ